MPLSRYVSTLIGKKKDGWPKGYFERTCGFLEGEFPLPEDRPPEPVEWDE